MDNSPRTVKALLEFHARQTPELVMLCFDSGEQYTATQLLKTTRTLAANLKKQSVDEQDYVLSWLPNCPLAVLLFLALNYIGAIYVPINTAYRGRLLEHVIQKSTAKLLIADGRLVERLEIVKTAQLEKVLISGDERLPNSSLTQDCTNILFRHVNDFCAIENIQPEMNDTQTVIFTSGTTGPSKGVLCSYQHMYKAAMEFKHVGPGDTNQVALPMFHVGGVLGMMFALVHGGCAAFVARFSTSEFWATVRKLHVTSVGLLGAMVQYLMSQEESAEDKIHPVNRAVIAPMGDDALAFGQRFGIEVHTEFNMTELSVPLWGGPNPVARGTCGKPRPGVQLKLVNSSGKEVAVGTTGELLVQVENPFDISHGYLNDAEATAQSWREGWFHTGDLFYRDDENNYYFVDRAKDALRRRGENISSFEVEEELLSHPLVDEAAIVAVPGDGGEDEILAVIVTGRKKPDIKELTEFLAKRMAYFMVPRYFRFINAMPMTPTQKIEKYVLRNAGITADTVDREALGIKLKADKLEQR